MNVEIKISKRPIPYIKALKYLEKRVNDIKSKKGKDFIWILEHPTTYTAGVRASNEEILDNKNKIIPTNRGGKITLHNPGQKIVYFAINLNDKKKDIRNFIKFIEKSIIDFLKIYKIKSKSDRKNIGIWVKNKKIAAIGVKVSRWVAYHGCSINIKNNIKEYQKIIPCGLSNNKITSIKNEGILKINKVEENLKKTFVSNLRDI